MLIKLSSQPHGVLSSGAWGSELRMAQALEVTTPALLPAQPIHMPLQGPWAPKRSSCLVSSPGWLCTPYSAAETQDPSTFSSSGSCMTSFQCLPPAILRRASQILFPQAPQATRGPWQYSCCPSPARPSPQPPESNRPWSHLAPLNVYAWNSFLSICTAPPQVFSWSDLCL